MPNKLVRNPLYARSVLDFRQHADPHGLITDCSDQMCNAVADVEMDRCRAGPFKVLQYSKRLDSGLLVPFCHRRPAFPFNKCSEQIGSADDPDNPATLEDGQPLET